MTTPQMSEAVKEFEQALRATIQEPSQLLLGAQIAYRNTIEAAISLFAAREKEWEERLAHEIHDMQNEVALRSGLLIQDRDHFRHLWEQAVTDGARAVAELEERLAGVKRVQVLMACLNRPANSAWGDYLESLPDTRGKR